MVDVARSGSTRQRSHEGANHRVAECVRFDAEGEVRPPPAPRAACGGCEGVAPRERDSNRGSRCCPSRGAAASFIAWSSRGSSTHRRSQRASGSGASDTSGVAAGQSGKARVEGASTTRAAKILTSRVPRATPMPRVRERSPYRPERYLVEPADNRRGGASSSERFPGREPPASYAQVDVANLVARMHPRIGAPGDGRRDFLARGHSEGPLQSPLDGTQPRLRSPPAKVSAVGSGQAQAPPRSSSHARTPPMIPASLGTTITSSPMRRWFDAVIRFEFPPPRYRRSHYTSGAVRQRPAGRGGDQWTSPRRRRSCSPMWSS